LPAEKFETKKDFNLFPSKAEIHNRDNFENLRVVYGYIRYVTNSFCKNMLNIAQP
jgi:hypothetical protein